MPDAAQPLHRDLDDLVWTTSDYEAFFAHDDPEVRAWALSRLHRLDSAAATSLALRGLGDRAREVQGAALDHIETLEPVPLTELRDYAERDDILPGLRARALEIEEAAADEQRVAESLQSSSDERVRLELELEDDADGEGHPALLDDEALRELATRRLGAGQPQESSRLLDALARRPWRWASRLVGERLEALLATEIDDEIWDAITDLGDPELLDVVLRQWRADEPLIARTALFLATVGDRIDELPEQVRTEAALARREIENLESDVRRGRDLSDLLVRHDLRLRLRCTECGRTYVYAVERAFVDSEVFGASGTESRDGDGVVLGRIVTCKNCGADDRYTLSAQARLLIASLAALGRAIGADRQSPRVVMARLQLWDGTPMRRPTQGIETLRALCERQPDAGEPWRRLGNLCERFGLMTEAEDAWRRAIVDEKEVEAAYSLATRFADRGRSDDALEHTLIAIERMPGAKELPNREAIARTLCEMLRGAIDRIEPPVALMATWLGATTAKRQIVHVSSVDLRDLHRWDRLAELLGSGFFVGLRFTPNLPEEPNPQLLRLLDAEPSSPSNPYVRSQPEIGRNAPCPCGSGLKHKKCCLR